MCKSKPYSVLRQELKNYLIRAGLTYSPEREPLGEPTQIREQSVDNVINYLLDYMIGEGYVQASNIKEDSLSPAE